MSIKIIHDNKKARFDFEIIETYEAGLVLQGSEVKSLREGQVNLKDSYVVSQNNELFLQNAHISVYRASSYNNHMPERNRKLLLHREQIDKIERAITEKGLSCVPLKMYWKEGRAKVELGIARGKKRHDKRESLKTRDANRELQQLKKSSR
jgi:SsrA-binding protein